MAERRAAIVTGGGTGIGRGIVDSLTAAGVDCLVAGRRRGPLEETARLLAGAPGAVEVEPADVTVAADRERVVRRCLERFGRVDVLVNNAGGSIVAPLLDVDESEWRQVLAINAEAPFFLAQLVIPDMRARGWGRIVNIGSIMAALGPDDRLVGWEIDPDRGPPRAPSYGAAKAGVAALSRDLATAVGRWGITVNTVVPGFVERPESPRPPESRQRLEAATPVGRLGVPLDIGHAVRYLASEEASFVTGADLRVDGGFSIA